ncbi:MAG: ABC transporter transmembrane domain-containing protein [bacterium]
MVMNLADFNRDKNDSKNDYFYCLKRLFPYIKPYLGRTIFAMLLSIPIGALDGATPVFVQKFIDQLNKNLNMMFVVGVPLLIVLFATVQGVLNYLSAYYNTWVATKITQDIKDVMFKKLLTYESAFYDKNPTGLIVSRFNSDVDQASSGLVSNLRLFLSRLFSSISLISVLLYNSWQLAIIAIVVLGCAFLPLKQLRKKLKFISDENIKLGGEIYTVYNETCSGNRTVASYNLQGTQTNKFKNSLQRGFYLSIKSIQATALIGPSVQFISACGLAIVVGFSSYLIKTHQLTTGSLASFIIALILLYQPIKTLGNTASQAQNAFFAMGRILGLLDSESSIKENKNSVEINDVKNSITFENVTFEYIKDKIVLNNINLNVKVGETLALVGNSGGGKSTLVNLIPRFYDVLAGSIKIDGIDIRDIKINSLRDQIAVVFQDNFLFDGTIRENILLGNPSATDEQLLEVVKNAYLEDFINSLEFGLDTKVGERGVLLSGGQKQRVAIARALIKNAPIIVLDEATSALDNKSEAVVQCAIEKLMENRTVFVIAHRLSTVKNATRIAVIDDGQIVEIGSHDDLMTREHGRYKNLYMAQFKVNEQELSEKV